VRPRRVGVGVVLKVSTVSGDTISAVNRANVPVTVTVSTSTTIVEAGSPISITAITPGAFVRVRGPRTAAHTIAARSIMLLAPIHRGTVTAVNGTTLTLTAAFGRTFTVQTSPTTRYRFARRPRQIASLASVVMGARIAVEGPLSADKTTITALRITIVRA
jgi:hypothetical protein